MRCTLAKLSQCMKSVLPCLKSYIICLVLHWTTLVNHEWINLKFFYVDFLRNTNSFSTRNSWYGLPVFTNNAVVAFKRRTRFYFLVPKADNDQNWGCVLLYLIICIHNNNDICFTFFSVLFLKSHRFMVAVDRDKYAHTRFVFVLVSRVAVARHS